MNETVIFIVSVTLFLLFRCHFYKIDRVFDENLNRQFSIRFDFFRLKKKKTKILIKLMDFLVLFNFDFCPIHR